MEDLCVEVAVLTEAFTLSTDARDAAGDGAADGDLEFVASGI